MPAAATASPPHARATSATNACSAAPPVTTTRAPCRSRTWRPTAANAVGDQRRPGKLSPEPGCKTTHGRPSGGPRRAVSSARPAGSAASPPATYGPAGTPAACARSRNERAAWASRRNGTRTVGRPSRPAAPLVKPTRCGIPAARQSRAPTTANCSKSSASSGASARSARSARARSATVAAEAVRPDRDHAVGEVGDERDVRGERHDDDTGTDPAVAQRGHDGTEERPVADPPELQHGDRAHRPRGGGAAPTRSRSASAAASPRASAPPATRSRAFARERFTATPPQGRATRGPAAARGSSLCGSSTDRPGTPRDAPARVDTRASATAVRAAADRGAVCAP